jgi:hypothetical protein
VTCEALRDGFRVAEDNVDQQMLKLEARVKEMASQLTRQILLFSAHTAVRCHIGTGQGRWAAGRNVVMQRGQGRQEVLSSR